MAITLTTLYSSVLFQTPMSCASATPAASAETAFAISDEDLDLLESMGFTRDQAKEMATMVNNLTPEEQQALTQIGQEIEKEMKQSGIDPNDPEQLFNYFSNMQEPGAATELPVEPVEKVTKEPSKVTKPTVQPINPQASADIRILLDEILEFLASLRQKASSSEQFSHRLEGRLKQELDELTYYLHILTKEELKPFIIAKDAANLYKTLSKLHEVLATYEPLITTKSSFEEGIDDPYKTLGINFGASAQEIRQTFNELKEQYNPALIEQDASLNDKDKTRKLKEAKLNYQAIKNAYESLSNPKEKAQIDKTLRNRKAQKQQAQGMAERAFTQCSNAITNALYEQNLIKQIQDLLTKYAPEEKKKADEWEKARKEALEQQKKLDTAATSRAKSAQAQGVQGMKTAGKDDETGKRFWDTYRPPTDTGFKGAPKSFGDSKGTSTGPKAGVGAGTPDKGAGSKPSGAGDKKSGGDKKEDKKDDKKGGKGDDKEDKKVTASEKSIVKAADLLSLMHKGELEELNGEFKGPKLSNVGGYTSKDPLRNLFFNQLPTELAAPYEQPKRRITEEGEKIETPEVLAKIDAFMQKYKIDTIAKDYDKLAQAVKDAKPEELDAFKSVWQSFAKDTKPTIDNLRYLMQNSLGFKGLDNTNPKFASTRGGSKIHRSQIAHHQLDDASAKKAAAQPKKGETKKPAGTPKPTDAGYLKHVRDSIVKIVTQFDGLAKKLAPKKEEKKPEAKKEEPEEAKKKGPEEAPAPLDLEI